jgi:hypothetical protein
MSPAPAIDEQRQRKQSVAALLLSWAIYAIVIGVNLDPAVTKVQAGVAGDRPFGIPVRDFFMALNAVLFFPVFWWTSSLMKLQAYASRKQEGLATALLASVFTMFELALLFTSVKATTPPDIRRARNIAFAGFLYFAALVTVWIVLTARAGV